MCVSTLSRKRSVGIFSTAMATAAVAFASSASAEKLYVADSSFPGQVRAFDIGTDGQLTNAGTPLGLTADFGALLTKLGTAGTDGSNYVYAIDTNGSGFLFQLTADTDNTLTQVASRLTADSPSAIVTSPDGQSVYLANSGSTKNIRQMDVGVDGALSDKSAGPVAVSNNTVDLAINPQGNSLYIADSMNNLARHSIEDGVVSSSPEDTLGVGFEIRDFVFTPNGDNAYLATGNSVYQYSASSVGALTAMSPTHVSVEGGATDIAVSPNGNDVYVLARESLIDPEDEFNMLYTSRLYHYTVSSEGTLDVGSSADVYSGRYSSRIQISNDGQNLYMNDAETTDLYIFDIDQETGNVAPADTSSLSLGGEIANDIAGGVTLAPDANMADISEATAGEAVTFNASTSENASEYIWDFGDGSDPVTTSSTTVEHTYETGGEYQVTLEAVGNGVCAGQTIYTGETLHCFASGLPGVSNTATQTVDVAGTELPPTTTEPTTTEPTVTEPVITTPVITTTTPTTPEVAVVKLLGGKNKPKVKRTAVAVTISCSGGASCSGNLLLTAKMRNKSRKIVAVTVGKVAFSIDPNSNDKFTLKLSKLGKKLLSKRGSLRARVKIQTADGTINANQKIKFKKSKSKKR